MKNKVQSDLLTSITQEVSSKFGPSAGAAINIAVRNVVITPEFKKKYGTFTAGLIEQLQNDHERYRERK